MRISVEAIRYRQVSSPQISRFFMKLMKFHADIKIGPRVSSKERLVGNLDGSIHALNRSFSSFGLCHVLAVTSS